ncbi:MAG: NADPH:quinone reductase [Candidatus Puniceispirillaceae bacterium]
MTRMMQAVWYEANGAAQDILVSGEMPVPDPGAGEVLVRLHASGVNPSDVKARAGSRPMAFERVIPHSDGAGIVEAVGAGVDPSLEGSRVFVRNGQWQRAHGTAAQFIAIDAGCVHPLPETVGFEVGAALGIPALTAAYAVLKDGPVDGETILIHGGGGTVARLAVQIAVDCGATVIATTGDMARAGRISDAGAVSVLDYRDPDLVMSVQKAAESHDVTRIIDPECGANIATSLDILAEKGVIVGYGSVQVLAPELPFLKMMFKNITLSSILVYLLGAEEACAYAGIVGDMLERQGLDVPIQEILPLHDAARAHQLVEAGNRSGAVILATG